MNQAAPQMPEARAEGEIFPPRPMAVMERNEVAQFDSSGGNMMMQSFNSIITAQRVAVARDLVRVQNNLRILAGINADMYVYSWPVNNSKSGTQETISGPTIKLANDLLREFGNAIVDVAVEDKPEHWVFHARFTDLETGTSMVRLFQQRKNQTAGKKMDADRQMDIAFQIGQSKAIRNVIVNALQSFATFMQEEAERNVLKTIGENSEKALEFISKQMERTGVEWVQIEARIGRRYRDWTAKDFARVYLEFKGVAEGLVDVNDLFSDLDVARARANKADEDKDQRKQAALREAAAGSGPGAAKPKEPETTGGGAGQGQGQGGQGAGSQATQTQQPQDVAQGQSKAEPTGPTQEQLDAKERAHQEALAEKAAQEKAAAHQEQQQTQEPTKGQQAESAQPAQGNDAASAMAALKGGDAAPAAEKPQEPRQEASQPAGEAETKTIPRRAARAGQGKMFTD